MTTNYNFNSRETYLAAAAEWKGNYARLTLEARKLRAEFNEAQRVFSKTSYREHAAYWGAHKEVEKARSARESLRREANEALADRAAMKEEAAHQWDTQRALAG